MTDIRTELMTLLNENRVRTDADSLGQYGLDWTRFHTPAPSAVVFPRSVDEVAAIVRWANQRKIGLVPSGGRTGLSAGAVATQGEVVVSFDLMRAISDFDPVERTVTIEAGVVTEQLQGFAAEHGLYYPVDFASRGSSQLGGNISTNAGGIKVIRYGLTRDWVMGLTVVTGQGDVLRLNNGLVKNATGYDLRHLFIGAEGTLGFIVGARMRLARQPRNLTVLLLAVPELDGIMSVFRLFNDGMPLTAFEFFSEQALGHVLARGHSQRPFESASPYYVLLEFEAPTDAETELAFSLFEKATEAGWAVDGIVSQSEQQAKDLWRLREDISESITPRRPYKNDISVTVSKAPAFMRELDAILAREYPDFEVVWFGHIGDGNLHINVLKPEDMPIDAFKRECERVSQWVFELVKKFDGSISAEHGVGLLKRDYLGYSRSAEEMAYMRAIKQVFDPNGIINPGKLVP
ncbi:FAD-binding oxidoreductase [Parachitinimonas caeni]|uniref:FAD-binding oxidoreductase n=1 Tax=Parachitinimonas caeni TaxID=3031301 RepID=A0ABT7E2S4_9NEIS|nr:FAD-binding oxidoreductase [Parachitinimonas caeni]MDK2126616.1 FAD-binding oxidoreductase [Parachitinimonas caeni]